MTLKYKVSEIAKDLNVSGKAIIELISEYFGGEPKKTSSALTDEEANVILDYYTQKNTVKDFNAYFNSKSAEVKKPEPKKEAPKKAEPKKAAPKKGGAKSVKAK